MPTPLHNTASQDFLFNVEHSFSDRPWHLRPRDERLALTLHQRLQLPSLSADIVASRGIDLEEAPHFLNPTLKHYLPNPFLLQDMEKATDRVIQAIENKEKLAVFGDYDVDGGTSSALLIRYFRMLRIELDLYIPDRMKEGYGPNAGAFEALHQQGNQLIFTVDCGTLSYEPLAAAKKMGLDVIVLDHHIAEPELPEAVALINPNRLDDLFPFKEMAAVGVCFLFLTALNRKLRLKGFFKDKDEPNLLSFLDLVALGTVCDVMPLKGLNRAFVTQGLKVMKQRANLGIAVLSDVAKVSEAPSAYHLGFMLGPRINAGGRIGESSLGAKLLTTEDPSEALTFANRLNDLNQERKDLEAMALEQAIMQAEDEPKEGPVIVCHDEWHPGIIGIVASRLKERYQRPAMVISFMTGEGKGSGRSVSGFALGSAIIAAKQAGILVAGGGHDMAAGLTIERDRLQDFKAFMQEKYPHPAQLSGLIVDAVISSSGLSQELIKSIDQIGPYGMGNPRPHIAIPDVRLVKIEHLANQTMRFLFAPSDQYDGELIPAMLFRATDTPLAAGLTAHKGKICNIVGQLKLDTYRGQVQMILEDAAPSDKN